MTIVAGIDASLSQLAAVVGPHDWMSSALCPEAWRLLDSEVWTREKKWEGGEIVRIAYCGGVANGLAAWLADRGVTHCWFEAYAMGQQSRSVTVLAELGGILRDRIGQRGIEFASVEPATLRKHLLGHMRRVDDDGKKLPDIKERVVECVDHHGARFSTTDEYDAFAVFNYACHLFGGGSIATPEPPPRKKTRKRAA